MSSLISGANDPEISAKKARQIARYATYLSDPAHRERVYLSLRNNASFDLWLLEDPSLANELFARIGKTITTT